MTEGKNDEKGFCMNSLLEEGEKISQPFIFALLKEAVYRHQGEMATEEVCGLCKNMSKIERTEDISVDELEDQLSFFEKLEGECSVHETKHQVLGPPDDLADGETGKIACFETADIAEQIGEEECPSCDNIHPARNVSTAYWYCRHCMTILYPLAEREKTMYYWLE